MPNETEPDVTVFVCGVKCDHTWDSPEVILTREEHEMDGGTVICSKCGQWAINVSMMEGH